MPFSAVPELAGDALLQDLTLFCYDPILLVAAIRAHQHAAGAKKNTARRLWVVLGAGSAKIHALVDALGNAIGFTLTGSQHADIGQATELLKKAPDAEAVLADKGYDSEALVQHIEAAGAEPIIPPRCNRKSPRHYDHYRYQARHLVERFFNRLKQFRRIATRYEKLCAHFAAMVTCGCIVLWLK